MARWKRLPGILPNRIPPVDLARLPVNEIRNRIIRAHEQETLS